MHENIFEVGLPVSIETEYKFYLTTHIIGWERDAFLLTGIAHSPDKSGSLKIHAPCKIRFLKDGVAYGFETRILAFNTQPFPFVSFQYPQIIEQFKIRKFDRIKSNFPARLTDKKGSFAAPATVTDISEGGCGLSIDVTQTKNLDLQKEYEIDFTILETDMHLNCCIRKMKTGGKMRCLGLEFCRLTPEEKEKIKLFLEACTNIFTARLDSLLTKMKTTDEILGGRIEELPVSDILQILDHLKKDGIVYVASAGITGSIEINNGRLMNAFWENLRGEDALVALLSLKDGLFHFKIGTITSGNFVRPINSALMDACRLIDEREEMKEYFPSEKDTLILAKDHDHRDADDPEIQAVLGAFRNGASGVMDLHNLTGFSQIQSGLIAAKLIRDGFLLKVT